MTADAHAPTLDAAELELVDAWWRAANYLSVGQIYLLDNPLLKEPLRSSTSSRGCSATGAPRRGSRSCGRT
jgi:phosphoketolase